MPEQPAHSPAVCVCEPSSAAVHANANVRSRGCSRPPIRTQVQPNSSLEQAGASVRLFSFVVSLCFLRAHTV
uniref:Uncharacterized protein n=1 Tax=Anguilla anguilla TaxID=7936 RepID=A0A0E9QRP0_ANGAN